MWSSLKILLQSPIYSGNRPAKSDAAFLAFAFVVAWRSVADLFHNTAIQCFRPHYLCVKPECIFWAWTPGPGNVIFGHHEVSFLHSCMFL
jgi:hypothetical protein